MKRALYAIARAFWWVLWYLPPVREAFARTAPIKLFRYSYSLHWDDMKPGPHVAHSWLHHEVDIQRRDDETQEQHDARVRALRWACAFDEPHPKTPELLLKWPLDPEDSWQRLSL